MGRVKTMTREWEKGGKTKSETVSDLTKKGNPIPAKGANAGGEIRIHEGATVHQVKSGGTDTHHHAK